jgi:hypothetical protein
MRDQPSPFPDEQHRVTDRSEVTSRNAVDCEWCDTDLDALSREERRDLRLRLTREKETRFGLWGTPHCTTCHEWTHYACEECGACLPRTRHLWPGVGETRSDRLCCSNACRQRAYRERRK